MIWENVTKFGQTSQNLGKTSLPPQIFLGWYGYELKSSQTLIYVHLDFLYTMQRIKAHSFYLRNIAPGRYSRSRGTRGNTDESA